MPLRTYLIIMLGGALGSGARVWITEFMNARLGHAFPWGTLLVNVAGSFVIGLVAALLAPEGRWPAPLEVRVFLALGVLGGFTTFSSFSLQTVELIRDGHVLLAAAYILGSVLICISAAALGLWIGR